MISNRIKYEKTTTVVDITWYVARNGCSRPIIQIEPTMLSGAKINYIGGKCAKFIMENNLGSGSMVKVTRLDDVIPIITEVISGSTSGEPQMPECSYIWNDLGDEIILETLNESI
jgi:NAD-dependent DNA ligase